HAALALSRRQGPENQGSGCGLLPACLERVCRADLSLGRAGAGFGPRPVRTHARCRAVSVGSPARGAGVDRRLPRRGWGSRRTHLLVRLLDLPGGAEHVADGARGGARRDADDALPALREGGGGGAGLAGECTMLCTAADRLSDGAVWTGPPRSVRGG